MRQIVILEEDEYIRQFASVGLRKADFAVTEISSGAALTDNLAVLDECCAVIVDVTLTDANAADICLQIRQQWPILPILLLADDDRQTDAMNALMTGADGCVSKPFSPAQLRGFVLQLVDGEKQTQQSSEQILSSGPFILHTGTGALTRLEQPIPLTRNEYTLLRLLLSEPGKAFSSEELCAVLWNDSKPDQLKTLIRKLRVKMEDDPAEPTYIKTVWGYGYQWR